jgi:Acyl-CoA synthetases (AMP-forming)/AMP-acid ligases II
MSPGAGGNAERMKLAELGPKLQFDDAINIQFTSGTTGHPRAPRSAITTS